MDADTIDVRAGEELDGTRLEPYLRERLPHACGAFSIRQFRAGRANLTYLIRFGERAYVLRRPPLGPLPKGAHDMRREYRVLSKLHFAFPLAPRVFVLCTDHAIVGADFVVMERREGIVVRNALPAALARDPARCRALGEGFIDAIAALHRVDYAAVGLGDLGRPQGYLARQLAGWTERWFAAQTPDRIDARALIAALGEDVPDSGRPALVHNDMKLDNALVAARDPATIVAIVDWDMCTLGDPLVDLGNVLALWREAGDPPALSPSEMPTDAPGFPTRDRLVARYARATGRDVTRIAWYQAFAFFRYAAIAQQIYARYLSGQTRDERFATMPPWIAHLVTRGNAVAQRR